MSDTPCIEWDRARQNHGYGVRWIDGHLHYVHRLAWAEAHGPIPKGMHVLHRCDNPPCFNVDHLFLGTHAENMRDMAAKGRANRSRGRSHGEANPNSKLTVDQVVEIRSLYAAGGWSQPALARKYSVAKSLIFRIVHHRAWTSVPALETAGQPS